MKRLLAEGVLLTLLLGVVWYSWDQMQEAQQRVARADSVRNAWRDSTEAVRERMEGRITLWRDSTRFYAAQTDSLEGEVEELDRDFGVSIDDLIATADTGGRVTVPDLVALEAVHDTAIRKCQLALRSCRSTVRSVENRLSIFRDTILPTVDSLNRANEALAGELRQLAQPGLIERVGRNIEVVVYTALIVSAGWCIASC